MSPEKAFTQQQKDAMVAAIKQAEKDTSGEIRVHIENRSKIDVLDRAADVFAHLNMHKTAQRNGVLIYVALLDHKSAILGDAGINAKVPADFWDSIMKNMVAKFKEGKITEGICEAVITAGEQLKVYFPYQTDDVNDFPTKSPFSKGTSQVYTNNLNFYL